jgi:chaperonin cofactor prefoldin
MLPQKQIGDIIVFCLSHFSENQNLQQKCNELYPKYLQDLIDRDKKIKICTDKLSQKIDVMLNNEAKLILDKNKIESELSKIQKYLKNVTKALDSHMIA